MLEIYLKSEGANSGASDRFRVSLMAPHPRLISYGKNKAAGLQIH